jgi:hypothetical protein
MTRQTTVILATATMLLNAAVVGSAVAQSNTKPLLRPPPQEAPQGRRVSLGSGMRPPGP